MASTRFGSNCPSRVNIGVLSHYYPYIIPCEIRVEVVQGIDLLQLVNTTLFATTMDFSKDSSLKNHNTHIHTCYSFSFFAILFISNC
jgi:hypothetical protein